MTTVSNYIYAFYNTPLPADDSVVKTNLLSFKIFFFIE